MAKKKITRKITKTDKLSMEGMLSLENIDDTVINLDVDEEGVFNIVDFLRGFDGQYVTISISNKIDSEIEPEAEPMDIDL